MKALADDIADLDERASDLVDRCRAIERRSQHPLAAEVLVAARVLAAQVSLLVEREGISCR